MSREQAKAFIERMKTDKAFRRKVMAIEDADGRIACIQSEGYACSLQDIAEAGAEMLPPDVCGGTAGEYFTTSKELTDLAKTTIKPFSVC
ncbi:Nif11-like leader peptide family natural product precursor [Chlorobium sp. N1]|uniref:Nif11-like leader peptide family natural product precursor n=1 Tax=Chlorobium sp. N1 TaxID=2491138 RepID=UPI00103B2D2D|nr:Nif11-like leader peptide family natural product precursor [Chlorobium sp. N1]TCD47035.1 Nif11-like leader peptide family natural product precursor [Chlorobium sp. N1]